MTYKVVAFVPSIAQTGTSENVAKQLEDIINKYAEEGWNYDRLESVSTHVSGTNGCFGLGGTPAISVVKQMLVFSKK